MKMKGNIFSRFHSAAFISAFAAIFAIALSLQNWFALNGDTAWLMIAAQRWLDGHEIYGNWIIEPNPPLIIYLSALPVLLAAGLGISTKAGAILSIFALTAAILTFVRHLLRLMGWSETRIGWSLIWIAAICLIFPGPQFAQREHIQFLLLLPYIFTQTLRCIPSDERFYRIRCVAAVLAGIAICIKFPALLSVLCIELMILLRNRRIRISLEIITIGLIGAAYLISCLILYPYYFEKLLPFLKIVYPYFGWPRESIVYFMQTICTFGMILSFIFLRSRTNFKKPEFGDVILCAAIGHFLAAIAQWKGFPNHWLQSLLLLSLIPISINRVINFYSASYSISMFFFLYFTLKSTVFSNIEEYKNGYLKDQYDIRLSLEKISPKPKKIAALSTEMFIFFPIPFEENTLWALRVPSLFHLNYTLRPALAGILPSDQQQIIYETMDQPVIEDLQQHKPDIIIVDKNLPLSVIVYYQRYPEFAAIWKNYHFITQVRQFEIYQYAAPE
jgi:hypothetical protein